MKYIYLSIAGVLCFTSPSCKKSTLEHIYTGDAYIYKKIPIPYSMDYIEEWDTVPVRIVVKFLSGNVYFESDHPEIHGGGFRISDSSQGYGVYHVVPFSRSIEIYYKLEKNTVRYYYRSSDPMFQRYRSTMTLTAHKN